MRKLLLILIPLILAGCAHDVGNPHVAHVVSNDEWKKYGGTIIEVPTSLTKEIEKKLESEYSVDKTLLQMLQPSPRMLVALRHRENGKVEMINTTSGQFMTGNLSGTNNLDASIDKFDYKTNSFSLDGKFIWKIKPAEKSVEITAGTRFHFDGIVHPSPPMYKYPQVIFIDGTVSWSSLPIEQKTLE